MEKQASANKAHMLLIPLPFPGHMNPMLQFSKRLASKGVHITLLATSDVKTSRLGGQASPINVEYISYEIEQGDEVPNSVESYLGFVGRKALKGVPGIIEKHKASGAPIKVIVYDSLLSGALELAHKLGLHGAPLFTQTCAVCSIYYHIQRGSLTLPLAGHTVSLPPIPALEIGDMPSSVHDGLYPGMLEEVLTKQFIDLERADWIFFNVFDKLEEEIAKWLSSQWPIKTIGPSIPSMFLDKRLPDDKDYGLSLFKQDDEACIKWLNAKATSSVVYVSFGSVANLGQDLMDEVAWGLLNSNNYFLWVVRETEQYKLPSNFKAMAAEKGLVVSWCPQLEVLAHKVVGSFMTHCGWNSTLEALSLGVPMLVMPQWADQPTNAKYVVDVWRTGVRVKARDKETFTREDIANCIKDVMDGAKGEELRANAIKWKELAVEAISEGGSSDKNIDEFISKVVSTTT